MNSEKIKNQTKQDQILDSVFIKKYSHRKTLLEGV